MLSRTANYCSRSVVGLFLSETRGPHTESSPGLAWKCREPGGELGGWKGVSRAKLGAGCTGTRAELEGGAKN